jgi:hypothetical protein
VAQGRLGTITLSAGWAKARSSRAVPTWTAAVGTLRFGPPHNARRQFPGRRIAPRRDQNLARQRHDHRLADGAPLIGGAPHSLWRALEIAQIRRRLIFLGRHQLAVGAAEIVLVLDADMGVGF